MESLNLLTTCGAALLAVFALLSLLAVVMRLILVVFPARPAALPRADAAVYAAITSAVHTLYPGASVTKLEEIR